MNVNVTHKYLKGTVSQKHILYKCYRKANVIQNDLKGHCHKKVLDFEINYNYINYIWIGHREKKYK
jgi:hypothetical protein